MLDLMTYGQALNGVLSFNFQQNETQTQHSQNEDNK
jgi:hypothetical protein